MQAAVKFSILALVLIVALVPLFELFDQGDDWTKDSDLVKSVLYAFLFLGLPFIWRRRITFPSMRSVAEKARSLIKFPVSPQLERKSASTQCPLFLSLRDLRI